MMFDELDEIALILKTQVKNERIITDGQRRQKSKNNQWRFYKAIQDGQIPKTTYLIHQGVDVNQRRCSDSWTPLHLAAYHGHHNIVKILIQNNAEVNPIIRESKIKGFTPLHLAVLKNHYECAQLLLEYGAGSYNLQNEDVIHPIHIAVAKDYVEMANLLLDYGANVNLRFNKKFFDLFRDNMKKNWWEYDELPLIQFSIIQKFHKMTRMLLHRGADINLKSGSGNTALMQAVQVHDVELVKYLILEKNAHFNRYDKKNWYVLHSMLSNDFIPSFEKNYDLKRKKLQIVRYLVEAEANIDDIKNWDRKTILEHMIAFRFSEIVNFILFESNFDYHKITSKLIDKVGNYTINTLGNNNNYAPFVQTDFSEILLTILKYLISKAMIGFPVYKELFYHILNHRLMLIEDKFNLISCFESQNMEMINNMKQTKIGNSNITYWYFLTCEIYKLPKLAASEDVKNLDLEYCKSNFYFYWYMFKSRLSFGIKRRLCFEKSIEAIFKLSQNHLPYDCCEKIVSSFTFDELDLFIMNYNFINF